MKNKIKDVLLNILRRVGVILKYAFFGYAWLYFFLMPYQIHNDIVKTQSLIDEIYSNQVTVYNEFLQVTQAQVLIDGLLANGINQSQDDAIKREKAIEKLVTDSEKRSVNRDVLLYEGINNQIKKPSYDYLSSITVYIVGQFKADPTHGWVGTGVIVKIDNNKTYILTNRHVMPNDTDNMIYYIIEGDRKIPLININVSKNENVDLSLNYVDEKLSNKQAVLGIADAKPQDSVFMVGHNLGRPFLYAEGFVAGFDARNNYELVIGIPSGPGNSGSGVIDRNGKLVGLLYAGSIITEDAIYEMDIAHGLCMNANVIRLFLGEYLK